MSKRNRQHTSETTPRPVSSRVGNGDDGIRLEALLSSLEAKDELIRQNQMELDRMRENELSRKEQEIASLRLEIDALKTAGSHSTRSITSVPFGDVSGTLPEFSGSDSYSVRKWCEDVDNMSQLLNWSPLEKLVHARKLLIGTAKLALRSRSDIDSWDKLKSFLFEEFSKKYSSIDAHRELQRRTKRSNESFQDYYLTMREIGSRANIEEKAVIQYIVEGIKDSSPNRILLLGANSFSEFKGKLDLYTQVAVSEPTHSKPRNFERKIIKCYSCGGKGHKSSSCPTKSKGTRCFSCNQFGHITTNCPSKSLKKSTQTAGIVTRKGPFKVVDLNGKPIVALIDTGSDVTLLRQDEYERIGSPPIDSTSIEVQGVSANTFNTLGSFNSVLKLDNDNFFPVVHVVPNNLTSLKMIIGNDILCGTQVTIKEDEVKIQKLEKNFPMCLNIHEAEAEELVIGNPKFKTEVRAMISSYVPLKKKESKVELRIHLKDETPICQYPRRLPDCEKQIVDEQVKQWLEDGIIRRSESDFASPIVLVDKRDGSKRLCVDYRRLNRIIIKDRYPLPLIEDQIDKLHAAKVYTTLDLANGFFHVPVAGDSVKYTAFVTPSGHYKFLRVPFGLCNAPAVFQGL